MFQRFHQMKEDRDERGFTLIELLVVVLIIAILAAIAIPFFLRQRERSWESQAQSALKNAATAMESYATANNGNYPAADQTAGGQNPAALQNEGFRPVADAPVNIWTSGANVYCLQADHANLSANWHYLSTSGRPQSGNCPP